MSQHVKALLTKRDDLSILSKNFMSTMKSKLSFDFHTCAVACAPPK